MKLASAWKTFNSAFSITWRVEGDDKEFRAGLTKKFDEYYGKNLIAAFGHKKLSQITSGDVERFLMKLSRTKTTRGTLFAPVTVRMHYEQLNQLFNLAIRERVHDANPCARQAAVPYSNEQLSATGSEFTL